MAFNPFEAFSIRSKLGRSVMAVLGIVVMLTFVLSTGMTGQGNDFFDQLKAVFTTSGKGEVVATAYDDKIYERDLSEVARQRRAANTFLQEAVGAAYLEWARDLKRDLEGTRLTAETKRDLERFITLKANSPTDPRPYVQFLRDVQIGQAGTQFALALFRASRLPPESEDRKAVEAATAILLYELSPGFRLVPFQDTDRDTLDFIVLLKKADQLGIHYSRDGVLDLIRRDTFGRLTPQASGEIETRMRKNGRLGDFSADWLAEAIGNEYRAQAALAAVQGKSPHAEIDRLMRGQAIPIFQQLQMDLSSLPFPGGQSTASALPGGMTPHEFWDFYKDRCSEHTFAVLEVKAEDLLGQVQGAPTPKERVELFKKYQSELPDPSKDRPGFKEPRRVKVEYVTLDATGPRVTGAVPKVQAASVVLSGLAGPMSVGGNGVTALFQAAHPGLAETLPVRQVVAERMEQNLSKYQAYEWFTFVPRDTSVFRPEPVASALGVLAGHPDLTTFVAAAAAVHQQVEVIDHRTRVPFLLQAVLAPANPTAANALGMPAFSYALNPKLPPEGLYLASAKADLAKQQRHHLFEADVQQLTRKLADLATEPLLSGKKVEKSKEDKIREDSRKLIADWLKDRGLTPAGTKEPKDQWSLATDPDLKPLNEKALPEPDGTNSLVQQLYESDDFRFGARPGAAPRYSVQPFRPFWFPADPVGADLDKPNHLVWVSQEVAANTYPTLENADRQTNGEMTRRVDRAWKLEKAKALAKAEADRLAEQVKAIARTAAADPGGVEKQLKDLAERKKVRKFDLERLALLKFEHGATQAQQGYQRPRIDKAQVLYPTENFVDRLLELRKEPVGAVTVLPDAPRSRYYVACEVQRVEKTIDQFRDVFVKATAVGPAQNPLYLREALPEERGRAMLDVMARLRAEAGLDIKEAFKNREKRSDAAE